MELLNRNQLEAVLFMKIEHGIKQNLESPEHGVNFSGFSIKNPFVSFFLDNIYCDTQGHPTHP